MLDLIGLWLSNPQDAAVDLALRLSGKVEAAQDVAEMAGRLYGPCCAHSRTLPTEFQLRPLESDQRQGVDPGRTLAARIVDPCYWSPRLPFLYQASIEWRDDDGRQYELRRSIGLRRLAVRGRNLYRDSRRVVLRGVRVDTLTPELIASARQHGLTLWSADPAEMACDLADEQGVELVADLRGVVDVDGRLRALAMRPSSAVIVLDAAAVDPPGACDLQRRPGNALLAIEDVFQADATLSKDAFSPAVVVWPVPQGGPAQRGQSRGAPPVLAIRAGQAYADFAEARRQCDQLQAELAPEYDLAGYFVAN